MALHETQHSRDPNDDNDAAADKSKNTILPAIKIHENLS
jgi:hypothetical protein